MSLAMIPATAHAASRRKAALPTVSALVAILASYIGELARILRGAQLLVQISTALWKARYLANLWNCPRSTAQGLSWWCGHEELQPCQSSNGHFVNYLSGAIRVRASTTTTLSSPINSASEYGPASGVAATNVSTPPDRASATSYHAANRSDNNSTASPVPSSTGSSHIATAIGFGVGVPLGIAALGFLGFLFYRERWRGQASEQLQANNRKAVRNSQRESIQEVSPIQRLWPQELHAEGRTVEAGGRY
ncbi:MAG: hypothetical protein M1830_000579 [Pleopsidium flavum]|nr:MAG: hypothetical protein M1830_000579 [Pleopsidium flavum]